LFIEFRIIIVLELALIAEGCELIGNPVSAQKSSGPSSSSGDQPGRVNASLRSFGTSSVHGGMVGNQTMSVAFAHSPEINQSHDTSSRNYGSGRFAPTNAPPFYM
jgi:replication factor A1